MPVPVSRPRVVRPRPGFCTRTQSSIRVKLSNELTTKEYCLLYCMLVLFSSVASVFFEIRDGAAKEPERKPRATHNRARARVGIHSLAPHAARSTEYERRRAERPRVSRAIRPDPDVRVRRKSESHPAGAMNADEEMENTDPTENAAMAEDFGKTISNALNGGKGPLLKLMKVRTKFPRGRLSS